MNINKKLLEDYLTEVKEFTYKRIVEFQDRGTFIEIEYYYEFTFDEGGTTDFTTISLFDLISFVYSKI